MYKRQFTASASDVDGNDLVFSLTGADSELFAVDSSTGEVSFLEAPDFEMPSDVNADNVYDLVLNVNDGSVTTTQLISVTVSDVNEAPQIETAATVSVDEGQISIFAPAASDDDGDALTYSLSGTDAGSFAIDAMTGAVTFLGVSDFEAPGDVDGDNVYSLTLGVSDGTLSAEQAVTVSILDTEDLLVQGSDATDILDLSGQTEAAAVDTGDGDDVCLLYTSPSPRD